jgi:DNA-binding response OmpR family regulator
VIVSDFMLPGISGLDLIQLLRSNVKTANVPLLMVTGHTNFAMEGRALAAGADAFLYKPFTLSQLRGAVGKLLRTVSR